MLLKSRRTRRNGGEGLKKPTYILQRRKVYRPTYVLGQASTTVACETFYGDWVDVYYSRNYEVMLMDKLELMAEYPPTYEYRIVRV